MASPPARRVQSSREGAPRDCARQARATEEQPLEAGGADQPWLVRQLRERRAESEWNRDQDLVFTVTGGKIVHVGNLRRRVLKPAAEEAGVPWASGFHVFRHSCASMLFQSGRNAVQVQHFLGHHSAAFTLATYVHLLEGDDLGGPLDLESASNCKLAGVSLRPSARSPFPVKWGTSRTFVASTALGDTA